MDKLNISRRNFIKKTVVASTGISGWLALGNQFSLVSTANANNATDYKALVCIFLLGGNDSFNMIIPTSAGGYNDYQSTRQNLAIAKETLLPITPLNGAADSYGFNPALQPIHEMFNQGDLAIVNNVGTLIQPVTKDQILQASAPLPSPLFSHNDQQKHWQTAWPQQNQKTGWAGRVADLKADQNANLPMNISLLGTNFFQTGLSSTPYSMTAQGAPLIAALSSGLFDGNEQRAALIQSLTAQSQHVMERTYGQTINRATELATLVNGALENASNMNSFFARNNAISEDLSMVAQMISVEQQLPQTQQIYLVGMSGWDTHDNQVTAHARLLNDLSQAMADFNQALGSINRSSDVTTFTMSEFGRTLTSNGDGTDHGWGGVQMIMGGAVDGGKFYGEIPDLNLGSESDLGDGRIIPTTAMDQYASTLAKWFGLSELELEASFPNLGNFSTSDLSFMG